MPEQLTPTGSRTTAPPATAPTAPPVQRPGCAGGSRSSGEIRCRGGAAGTSPSAARDLPAVLRARAHRIDAATPPRRDRAVDGLRALAVLGVVLGHWLVTALALDGGGQLHSASPLAALPAFTPASWLLQTLSVFFLVGGHVATRGLASARERGTGYTAWLRARLARLGRPVAALLALWSAVTLCLLASGTGGDTVHTLVKLVLSPLWFLLVFAALTALTPLVARLHPLWPLAVVLHVDLIRYGFDAGPAWLGQVNLLAGWLVPYCLGAAWARGAFARRRTPAVLLALGTVATFALVYWAGYPAAMVGVPGAEVSNLNPPTLAAVTFGLAQCGAALLLREPLRRALRRPAAWAGVALLNLSAMTVFLWHQTALLAVTSAALPAGPLPGLHTAPDSALWVLARLAWLPVFGLGLWTCWAAFRRLEHPRSRAARGGTTRAGPVRSGRPAIE